MICAGYRSGRGSRVPENTAQLTFPCRERLIYPRGDLLEQLFHLALQRFAPRVGSAISSRYIANLTRSSCDLFEPHAFCCGRKNLFCLGRLFPHVAFARRAVTAGRPALRTSSGKDSLKEGHRPFACIDRRALSSENSHSKRLSHGSNRRCTAGPLPCMARCVTDGTRRPHNVSLYFPSRMILAIVKRILEVALCRELSSSPR